MSHVITLIGASGTHDAIAAIAEDLAKAISAAEAPVWLSQEACDLPFRPDGDTGVTEARRLLAAIPADLPIDSHVQPVKDRRKRMLLADMDSTIIQQECLDEVAVAAGIGSKFAAMTERAMRGELKFEDSLKERVGLLTGVPKTLLQQVLDQKISLTPGARELVMTMRVHGSHTVLVSGGFTFFTSAVTKWAGFDVDYANHFVFENDKITGAADPVLGRNGKLEAMEKEAGQAGIGLAEVLAVGDGANDLCMLKAAGLGVAFHAKPVLTAEADVKIRHGDLSALLFIQGYRKKDFVTKI